MHHISFVNNSNTVARHEPFYRDRLPSMDYDEPQDCNFRLIDQLWCSNLDLLCLRKAAKESGYQTGGKEEPMHNLVRSDSFSTCSDEDETTLNDSTVSMDHETDTFDNLRIDDFDRLKVLGEGQFGQVWLVSKKPDHIKPYALKILSKVQLINEDEVNTVFHEKQILNRAQGHPFIVQLFATFQDQGLVYFLEEFCQGGELFSLVHDYGSLEESHAAFYALGLADALAFLHSHSIAYRDIKSENVMLDREGYPKLIDFGYAKQLKDDERTTTFCGTPRYLSPEMVAATGHDCNVDNWALGVLIYELITGESPFYFDGVEERILFESIQNDQPAEFKSSKAAANLIKNLLIKDPKQRLQAANALNYVWFKDLNLEKLRRKEILAPWTPVIRSRLDTSRFDDWENYVEDRVAQKHPSLRTSEQALFQGF